jgi:hypothetical protein
MALKKNNYVQEERESAVDIWKRKGFYKEM